MSKLRTFVETLPPRRAAVAILLFDAVVLALCVFIGDNPAAAMREEGPVTWLSFLHLIAAAYAAYLLFVVRVREQGARSGWLWAIIAAGFAFLSLDEILRIHERMDHAIHWIFGLQPTPATDRIDDVIIGLYGLAALAALFVWKHEVLRFRRHLPLFAAGFACLALTVGFDLLSNDRSITDLLTASPEASLGLQQWFEAIEDSAKVFGEAFFLIAFLYCGASARAGAALRPGG